MIIAVYLGKTATEDSYGGLGRVTFNADGRTGTFKTNDGKASGRFDCGASDGRGVVQGAARLRLTMPRGFRDRPITGR